MLEIMQDYGYKIYSVSIECKWKSNYEYDNDTRHLEKYIAEMIVTNK